MTLTSEFRDAEAALRHGIVSQVVARGDLRTTAAALAARIAASPPVALRLSKKLIRHAAGASLQATLEAAASMQADLLCGDEHRQQVARFFQTQANRN